MPQTISAKRIESDVHLKVTLQDSGVSIAWDSVDIKQVCMYSVEQHAFAGHCSFSVSEEDNKILLVTYPASEQLYTGDYRIVTRLVLDGDEHTYDALAFTLKPLSDESGSITTEDVEVGIQVEEVDTTIMYEILTACQAATDSALAAEAAIEAAEAARVAAENLRVQAENAREAAEAARVQAEQQRVSAEASREDAEAARVQAESARVSAENLRVSAEAARVQAEQARVTAESARDAAEAARAQAESARVSAEQGRVSAEASRVSAESARVAAEAARVQAESARVAAEQARVTAEAAREQQAAADHTRAESDHTASVEAAATAIAAAEAADQAREAIQGDLAKKANKDGWYSKLVSGAAESLIGKEWVAAFFTNRLTGGSRRVGSGAAVFSALRGRTLKWNQKLPAIDPSQASSFVNKGGCSVALNDGVYTVTPVVGAETTFGAVVSSVIPVGHKVLLSLTIKGYGNVKFGAAMKAKSNGAFYATADTIVSGASDGLWHRINKLVTVAEETAYYSNQGVAVVLRAIDNISGAPLYVKNFQVFDITDMFGSGNEPSTAAEFEALYNAAYYADNAGTLLPFKGTGLKTVGFNIWDEQWEQGMINNDGTNASSSTRIRSKNYIPVFPGVTYYYKITQSGFNASDAAFYDINKQFISFTAAFRLNSEFVIPANAYYVRFSPSSQYGNTYKDDICINRSDTKHNGQYEPHHTETLSLPVTTATANNGEDVPFANGMNGYGGVYDTLTVENGLAKGGMKRIGIRAYLSGDESDTSVMTDGVNTVYILSSPIEYTFDTPFPVIYSEDQDGTETLLPEGVDSNGVPNTAPLDADIIYPIDAISKLNGLQQDFTSQGSDINFLEALKTAGIIAAYTRTYNSATGNYEYSITRPE